MFFRRPISYGGSFSHKTRARNLERLATEVFDLVVIGGGITGAGIARDAAMRGMKVALIEKGDFASGTSSRSSKLIHGGLRYLKQLDIKLVKESLFERERLLRLAPHLVHPAPFLIPIYSGWMERLELRIGLKGYDLLAGDTALPHHRNLSAEEVLHEEPLLRQDHLAGGFVYYDCLVDDGRLTLATIKSAHEQGAVVTSYTRAVALGESDGLSRVGFCEVMTGAEGETRARVLVAAAGPWTDELLQLHDHPEPMLRPTKGVHIVFPRNRLALRQVVVAPTEDKRILFVVPRGDFTYVGTTDTDYSGSLDKVLVEASDVDYLLQALDFCFPSLHLRAADIVSAWAGLRPLVREEGAPSAVSRDYRMTFHEDGLAVIAGGKLTTYRNMAKSLLNLILKNYAHRLPGTFRPCQTAESALTGGEMAEFPSYLKAQSLGLMGRWGLSRRTAEHLIESYGRSHLDILALALQDKELMEPLAPGCPVLRAEVVHAVEEEMALTLEDFMARRTGLLHFDANCGMGVAEEVSRLMSRLLGWDRGRRKAEIEGYREAVADMFHFRSESH
jgi:glycerol-3-phosphate dehydrogenase